jgi:hypothetical protein
VRRLNTLTSLLTFFLFFSLSCSFFLTGAGVNFDDGMGGGSILTRNVLANFCRESSDHASFNSWNRQVYIYDDANGNPTIQKMNDTISYNWILANYQSSMAG